MIRSQVIMNPLSLSLVLVLNIWTLQWAAGCNDQQTKVNGRCCDLCPPGKYMKDFCSDHQQTVCSTCDEGYFSSQYNIFDRCEKCRSCQQGYAENCTATTDAKCSCIRGFLCSDSTCSKCVENKCVTGEKLKRTDSPLDRGLIEYSYQCVPLCHNNEYFDVKDNVCRQRTQCSLFGFAEKFPGNKTHNAICKEWESHDNKKDFLHVVLGIVVLMSFTLFMLLSYVLIKKLMKHKKYDKSITALSARASNFQLSQEECGHELIIQDESKCSCNQLQLDLEKVNVFFVTDLG